MNDFSLPDKARVKAILIWGGLANVSFLLAYGACNLHAATRSSLYSMHFDFELSIPFVPAMIYFYLSLDLLFLVSIFVIKDPKSIKGFCLSLVGTTIVAAVIFVVFPGKLGFTRIENVIGYEGVFSLLHKLDKPHNLFPSLHVTYSTLLAMVMIQQSNGKAFHWLLILWVAGIYSSVVLVHQHHLFDVLTGFCLAVIGYKFIYHRWQSIGVPVSS